ncbi:lipid droplet-associated hydrolase [Paramormyrops kingsleyae]|uniref:lipid droplet-associated hydrolase n=1 Tax=Paramormyrops kingsleyae TaxID=1676925 RepID=UPI000CD5F8B2|nr:lipid droplet-associated hydrolase [Paramormyrops kingsleyae]XP_023690507.1 lipid droplet-associated hydrolase [Paramormyrops kingsleyae]
MGSLGEDGGGQVCDGVLEHLYCCGAATEVLKFGQRELGPPGGRRGSPPLLFLIIPGNPGLVGFYRPFMRTLWQSFQGLHPVWAVSHAGHCVPPDSMDMTEDGPLLETHDVFGLRGQIEHKMAFLKRHVPRDTKLVLIGHSIGCYIILEMMKRDPQLQVLKALLLFPTIERMAASPQGRLMTPVLCQLRFAAYLPVFLLSLLPRSLQAAMVKLVLSGLPSLDRTAAAAALSLFNVDCVANAMYMGSQEMRQVLERDNQTISQNLDKLVFYYGASDHWCPVEYYHDIKREFPAGNIQLCERGFRHAFVLDSGCDVAIMAADWIRGDLQHL